MSTTTNPESVANMSSPLPSSFDGNQDFYEENRWQKFTRRLKEEPLIPLGCLLTSFALFGASRSIRAGDHNRTNRMFRARIYAQGFTIVAMLAGSTYWQKDREKRKEFDEVLKEKKAKEKNEAWIRELEARDEEAQMIRAERDARRQGLPPPSRESVVAMVREKSEAVMREVEKKAGKAKGKVEEKVDVVQKKVEEGRGAASVVEEGDKKGILASVQELVWGKK